MDGHDSYACHQAVLDVPVPPAQHGCGGRKRNADSGGWAMRVKRRGELYHVEYGVMVNNERPEDVKWCSRSLATAEFDSIVKERSREEEGCCVQLVKRIDGDEVEMVEYYEKSTFALRPCRTD